MKPISSKVLIGVFFFILIIVIAFLFLVTKVDYSNDLPMEKDNISHTAFNLHPHLQSIDLNNLRETFPYSAYLDSANISDINALRNDLNVLDSVNPHNELLNQEVLSIALTSKLQDRIGLKFNTYNPDSLIRIIQWAEKFNAYAEMDPEHAMLFQVIYNHWFNFVSNIQMEYFEKEFTIKYNYKFRYINDRIKEKQFVTPIRGTHLEKIIDGLIQNKWSYLFNKFWYATSLIYKCIVGLFVFIIIFPYFYILKTVNNKS